MVTDAGPWQGPTLEEWLARFEKPEEAPPSVETVEEEITECEQRVLDGNR